MQNQTIPMHQIMEHNAKSVNSGYVFTEEERQLDELTQKREEVKNKLKSRETTNVKMAVAGGAIFVAIACSVLQAMNVRTTMGGMFGMSGIGIIPSMIAGIGFSLLGLLTGYSLKKSSEEVDVITGKRIYPPLFWLSIILCVIYIFGQVAIAVRAGMGLTGDAAFTAKSFILIILVVSLIELLVGYVFIDDVLDDAINMARLSIITTKIDLVRKRMGNAARLCDRHWLYYVHGVGEYNAAHRDNPLTVMDETESIKRAREYYRKPNKKA